MHFVGGRENRRARILIVHDGLTKLAGMLAILETEPRYELTIAESGYDALRCARTAAAPFDVVCAGASMRDLDGVSLLHELSIVTRSPWAGVLVGADRDVLLRTRDEHDRALAIVVEPYRPAQLIAAIERAVTSVETRRVLAAAARAATRIDGLRRTG